MSAIVFKSGFAHLIHSTKMLAKFVLSTAIPASFGAMVTAFPTKCYSYASKPTFGEGTRMVQLLRSELPEK
jgi:hypothetical protein